MARHSFEVGGLTMRIDTKLAPTAPGSKGEAPAVLAWQLIQLLDLNELVPLGSALTPRFCLIDGKGTQQLKPAKAVAIFDMLLGKSFLPQFDADWLDQLMTRYRVSAHWDEVLQTWCSCAGARGATAVGLGTGATPGIAVVAVLVAAANAGTLPAKQDYPEAALS